MAENNPQTPSSGGNPPAPPTEGSKLQTKKETVRINLPPKPTAAPTIKIPAPPVSAAAAAPGPTIAPKGAGDRPAAAPAAPAVAAAPAAHAATKSAPPPRRAPAVSVLDKVLAVVAFVVSLLVLTRLFLL